MKKILSFLFVATSLVLADCFGLWDSGSDRITGRYIVLWIDQLANQFIAEQLEENSSSSMEVVPAYVFAVGHNDDFIIAKQHPTAGFDGGYKINTTITNYFIVKVKQEASANSNEVFGPLSRREFDSTRAVLHLETIEFDQHYPDKP